MALDVGGTKLAAAVVSGDGRVLVRDQVPTPRSDAEGLYATVERLCRRVLDASGESVAAIGVGCGGPMRYPAGIVSPLNIPAWRDFPLRERLAASFGLPCLVDNDAKALVLAERWLGAGRGSRNVLGMVLSTGVGGGAIVDGRLLHGERGNAGHIGHVIVWPGGPPCGCGAQGCLEAIASGTGLERRLAQAHAEGVATVLPLLASVPEMARAARAGDELAARLFREASEGTGRAIASTAALLDLDVVAIGGGIGLNAWDLISPPLQAELARTARLDFTRNVRVVQTQLGDAAGLLGAAALGASLLGG